MVRQFSLLCVLIALSSLQFPNMMVERLKADQLRMYFPLAIGNRWLFESSESTPTTPVTETWEVTRRIGRGYRLRVQQSLLAKDAAAEFISISSAGIVVRAAGVLEANATQHVILKPPTELETTWKTGAGRFEITALNALAAVPAGIFEDCLEVTFWSKNGQAKAVTLYARGVGMVQRDESFAILGGLGGEDSPRQGKVSLWLSEWSIEAGVKDP